MSETNRSNAARAAGVERAKASSRVYRLHECQMFSVTN
jgi:hypothetical protein